MSSNFKNIRSHIRNITYRIDKTLPIYLREIDSSLVQYVKAFFIGSNRSSNYNNADVSSNWSFLTG